MRLAFSLLCIAPLLGCAPMQPPAADFPPTSPAFDESSSSSESSRTDGDGDEQDEVAEERELMADHSLDAAAANVRVIQNDDLNCPSEVMGLVDIHEPVQNEQQALDVLKHKAAKLGADAVVGVEFHHGEPGEEPTHLSGMAVRCHDLLQGRSYRVLGRIEVKGKMGKEDDAERELLDRARAMNADLVLNMGFEHGDGGSQPTRVWGTAVQFQ
jgi:uncharacterized protein YbjQ (UPF0145 family)